MPSSRKRIPRLSLLPSLEGSTALPEERRIDKDLLVQVSPDREDLLRRKSIAEIRRTLKLHSNSYGAQWLYRSRTRHNVPVNDDASIRLSAFEATFPDVFAGEDVEENRNDAGSSSAVQISSSLLDVAVDDVNDGTFSTWSSLNLSTLDQGISPRPLGPTHMLVVHATPPILHCTGASGSGSSRRPQPTMVFSEVIEIPINDLLFVLNVPNLKLPGEAPVVSVLPRRMHKELPKVLLFVPHLKTFPELVVYLHTKDQAALFDSIIPEWIHKLMHPLPIRPLATRHQSVGAGADITDSGTTCFPFISLDASALQRAFGAFIPCITPCTSSDDSDTPFTNAPSAHRRSTERNSSTIARELAEAARNSGFIDDPLVSTVVSLNALRDNLNYIGYYAPELWEELQAYHRILISAVSLRAKVKNTVDEVGYALPRSYES